ncbi:MAG: hypothetical protein ACRED1_15530, partial [Limisphaerales bacterium]
SLAKAESDAEFRTLATFPELADVFAPVPPPLGAAPPLPGRDERQAALDRVKVPAIGLMISAMVSVIMAIRGLATIRSVAAQTKEFDAILSQVYSPQFQKFYDALMKLFTGPLGVANYSIMIVIAILIFAGALKMIKLRSYEFAYTSAILAVLPCITPCFGWILGLIFGFWAMNAIGKSKAHFF